MNTENKSTELNDTDKKLHISDVSGSFTKKDLFEAFSHYAFASISNQPYNEEELIEEFEKWFKCKCQK